MFQLVRLIAFLSVLNRNIHSFFLTTTSYSSHFHRSPWMSPSNNINSNSNNAGGIKSLSFPQSIARKRKASTQDQDKKDSISVLDEFFKYEGRIGGSDINPNFRTGYVSIIGAPNMGKSTLINALMEEELCISNSRPQTTRHSILGILNSMETHTQILFLDTPGMIANPKYKLQEKMMDSVKMAMRDADLILMVVTCSDSDSADSATSDSNLIGFDIMDSNYDETNLDSQEIQNNQKVLEFIQTTKKNVIIIINKCDLLQQQQQQQQRSKSKKYTQAEIDEIIDSNIQKWRQLIPNGA